MNANSELREKMWELCYDLLPDGERSALIALIKSDPQAARMYAEVRLQADLVGFAAKVDDPSLILSATEENLKAQPPHRAEVTSLSRRRAAGGGARAAWATWIPAAAALVLIGLIVGGVYAPVGPQQQVAQAVLEVDAPLEMPAGVSNKIVLRSRRPGAGGEPAGVPVDVKVLGDDGLVRFQTMVETNANGVAAVDLPGHAVVPGARLTVTPSPESRASELSTSATSAAVNSDFLAANLPVTSAPPLMYYMFGTPVAQAGEEVQFAAIAVEPFTLESASPPVDRLVVKDAAGTPIVEPMWQTLDGLVTGTFELPPTITDPSRLASSGIAPVRARDARAAVRPFAAPPAEADLSKKNAAETDAAGADAAQDVAAKVEIAAATPLRQKAQENVDKVESLAATPERYLFLQNESRFGSEILRERLERVEQEGLAQLDRSQAEKSAQDRLDFTQRKLAATEGQLALSADQKQTDTQVIEAGQPVEVEIPAELADKRIVADVTSRGVSVVRQVIAGSGATSRLNAEKELGQQAAPQKIKLYVPPEVDGELQLKLADASQSPPRTVSEHSFFRQPVRGLKLQPQNLAARYDPGQVVSLKFQIVDENGVPAAAALGARVWREDVVPPREDLVMLADTIRQSQSSDWAEVDGRMGAAAQHSLAMGSSLSGVSTPATAPAPTGEPAPASEPVPAEKPAENQLAADAPSATAATAPPGVTAPLAERDESGAAEYGMFAGGDRQVADDLVDSGQVSLLVSNRAAIEGQLHAMEQQRQQSRQAWQATLGRLLVVGGVVVLAIVGLLFLVRLPVRVVGGTLAIVTAAASLMVGLFWTGHGRPQHTVAMTTSEATPATPKSAASPSRANTFSDDPAAVLDADPAALPEAVVAESAPSGGEPRADYRAADSKSDLAELIGPDKAAENRAGEESELKSAPAASAAEKQKADGVAAADAKMSRSGGLGGGAGGFGSPTPGPNAAPAGGKAARFAKPKPLEDAVRAPLPTAPPTPADKPADAPAATPSTTTPPAPAPATPAEQPPVGDADRPLARGGAAPGIGRPGAASAPAAIYFNPRATTDEQGFVTLEFQLPDVESEYRLLLDAFGNGRVGSSTDLKIVCRKPE